MSENEEVKMVKLRARHKNVDEKGDSDDGDEEEDNNHEGEDRVGIDSNMM